MNRTSRRNFVKSGVILTGAGFIGSTSVFGSIDCPDEIVHAPGTIPLNDILTDFLPIKGMNGKGLKKATVCDHESWKDKRISIIRRSGLMLGEAPYYDECSISPEILSETQREGYTERKVQFQSGTGDIIKGYLLVPGGATSIVPRPAIIAMHSTGPGSSQTIGLTPTENRCYGMELVQRGYVVLAIDVISAGERVFQGYEPYNTCEFYKKFPRWSAMGKIILDHQRGIDYLCSLDIVDPDRLGCIGHSLGGYNSYFLQAFDQRIKAAVTSCGLSPMGRTNSPYQFARDTWFVHFNPACKDYVRAGMIPCDIHEIMALCAPRPLFNYSGKNDAVYFNPAIRKRNDFSEWWQTVDEALNQVSRVYEIMGAKSNFMRVDGNRGHDFPAEVRETAYRWLDENLRRG